MPIPASIIRRWRCAPLARAARPRCPSSARTGAVHSSSRSSASAAGYGLAALEVDAAPRPGRSGSRATCSPRSAGAADPRTGRPRRRRARPGRRTPTISAASASDSAAVGCASQIRTSTVPNAEVRPDRPPHLRVLDDRARPHEELDVVAKASQEPNASGTPQRGKLLREGLGARGVQARIAAVEERRVGRDRQQQRQHRPQPVAHPHRAVGAAHADVDVQRERVVAPRDVLEPVLDAAVVLGVDDVLLAVVGPRVRAGGARARRRCSAASANSRRRAVALARTAAARDPRPRPERISISEEISSPAIAPASTGSRRRPSRSSSKRGDEVEVARDRAARTPPRGRR